MDEYEKRRRVNLQELIEAYEIGTEEEKELIVGSFVSIGNDCAITHSDELAALFYWINVNKVDTKRADT